MAELDAFFGSEISIFAFIAEIIFFSIVTFIASHIDWKELMMSRNYIVTKIVYFAIMFVAGLALGILHSFTSIIYQIITAKIAGVGFVIFAIILVLVGGLVAFLFGLKMINIMRDTNGQPPILFGKSKKKKSNIEEDDDDEEDDYEEWDDE